MKNTIQLILFMAIMVMAIMMVMHIYHIIIKIAITIHYPVDDAIEFFWLSFAVSIGKVVYDWFDKD